MKESQLKQRVFDQLFQGLALCGLLEPPEIEHIAMGIDTVEGLGKSERQLFGAVSRALYEYAKREAQA